MPRCVAKTSTGRRCKCSATSDSERCANHTEAPTYGTCTASSEELAAFRKEALRDGVEFNIFSRAYYNTLRELYNVAGDEMLDEYVSYRCLGLSGYNKMHEKRKKGFHARVKNDNPNSYYSLFIFIERRRQEKRAAAREAQKIVEPAAQNHCPICGIACEPADDDGHCSYSCASGGGFGPAQPLRHSESEEA